MVPADVAAEYRRLNATGKSAFRRWIFTNAIVGASLLTLVVLAAVYSGGDSGSVTAQKASTSVHAEAR
jgi:hypothetical protein